MGTGTLSTSGAGFGGDSPTSVGEVARHARGLEEEEEAPPEESEVVGGWLRGLGIWVEAPMGRVLLLARGVSGVLPMELNTGSSKRPGNMLTRAGWCACVGPSGVLFDPGIVGFEKGWSVGEASMV